MAKTILAKKPPAAPNGACYPPFRMFSNDRCGDY